jgi:hypothetical protein
LPWTWAKFQRQKSIRRMMIGIGTPRNQRSIPRPILIARLLETIVWGDNAISWISFPRCLRN